MDACKFPAAPISLFLLCSLRYLGRGWTFDDPAENSAISLKLIYAFFHTFMNYESTELFTKYVRAPLTAAEAQIDMADFAQAGFPGAV